MPRPQKKFPTPGKRRRGDSWQVFWRSGPLVFGVGLGPISEHDAESRRLEVALALRTGEWPAWAADAPAVHRHHAIGHAGGALSDYGPSLRGEVSGGWATCSMGHLRRLKDETQKTLVLVTPQDAQAFLDGILRAGRATGTRNRALAACSRFYGWAVRTGRARSNPFRNIHALKEPEPVEIVHLTRPERDRVLDAARGAPDACAVWLALYGGLRVGEIARADWADLNLGTRRLVVPKAKGGRRRVVPVAEPLGDVLQGEASRGRIVPWPANEPQWRYAADRLLDRLRRACPKIPAERIGWNSCRHTFGSLLAQAGVSLDKISAWMGNSPRVCRRHYAEFVPRDRRDEDIERLV